MLRTPTHIVEIGTNATTTTTTPLIQKLQAAAGTKYQYHDQYTIKNNNYNKATVKQLQQSFIYQHHQQQKQQQEKEPKYQQLATIAAKTAVEYQLQSKKQKQKQLKATKTQTTVTTKKLKKTTKFSTSSTSSSSSSTNSSLSSSDCSAISTTTTSSSDSSTLSAKTTKTNSSSSSTPTTTFTFKEHLLSRALLSAATPFSFMRTKKSKATAAAVETEIRKTSKRLFDFEDKTPQLGNNNKNNHNCKTGAAIPETKSTTTSISTRTSCFSNILNNNSSSSSASNSNNNNTKNINNNNNNYIKSLTTTTTTTKTKSRSITPTPPSPSPASTSNSASLSSTPSPSVLTNKTFVVAPTSLLLAVAVASPPIATTTSMSPTSQTPPSSRTSLFDSCHRKIRLIGGGPVAFLGGLVAKARRKERDGDQNSTDTKLYLEESVLERKLPEADLKALVDLPAGLDYNEWLASHTLALFEHVNLVYGTISEFCTTSGCPDMTGPGNRTYLWFDEKGKKTRVAAPQYIDYVMTFTQKTVSDESIFPTKYANEFPSSFESIARKILRLQFHVIAHLYAAHFREIALLGLHTHLNLTFAHLTALHRRFNLIDEKETDVLRDLEVALRLTDDTTGGITGSGSSQNDATETNSSSSGGGGGGVGGGVDSIKGNLVEEVNSVQHNNLMDCNATAQPPICTQPEANLKSQQFGGGGGLIGGILGDLSSGEFGDTMHYCTSAVPASSTINNTSSNHTSTPNTCSTNSTCTTADQQQQQQQSLVGAVTANGNNGAGALNFHLNNNHLAHHPHTHHHHYNNVLHHHNHPFAQNTGLIQCNASNAPTPTNATTSTTTA